MFLQPTAANPFFHSVTELIRSSLARNVSTASNTCGPLGGSLGFGVSSGESVTLGVGCRSGVEVAPAGVVGVAVGDELIAGGDSRESLASGGAGKDPDGDTRGCSPVQATRTTIASATNTSEIRRRFVTGPRMGLAISRVDIVTNDVQAASRPTWARLGQ